MSHYQNFTPPFEIPDSWEWVMLPEACLIPITDGTHQTPTYSDKENGIPFLSSKDVTSRVINWSNIRSCKVNNNLGINGCGFQRFFTLSPGKYVNLQELRGCLKTNIKPEWMYF